MSHDSLQALETVLERETRTRDATLLQLRQAEQRLEQVQAQGDSLQAYRRDTATRWSLPVTDAAPVQQLRTAGHFLGRLDEAIGHQVQLHSRAITSVERLRDELLQCERRMAALGKLIGQRRRAQLARQQRADQKATDEAARQVLAHARAMAGTEPLGSP